MSSHHVVIEHLCGCAKKRNLEQIRSFETKEEAEEQSKEWVNWLNNTFCGKHSFDSVAVEGNFVITIEKNSFVEACDI